MKNYNRSVKRTLEIKVQNNFSQKKFQSNKNYNELKKIKKKKFNSKA